MSLTNKQIDALYKLYPQAVTTRGDEAFDADGNQVQYDLAQVTEQAEKDDCKAIAVALLNATDWTQVPDCPLVNKSEFATYRATVRELAINPVSNPVFPVEPTSVW